MQDDSLFQWAWADTQNPSGLEVIMTPQDQDEKRRYEALHPNGAVFAFLTEQGALKLWDVYHAQEFMTIAAIQAPDTIDLRFSPSGDSLWCVTTSDCLEWDTTSLSRLFAASALSYTQRVKSSMSSRIETRLIVIDENTAIVYDATCQPLSLKGVLPGDPIDCAIHNQRAAVVCTEGHISIWQAEANSWKSDSIPEALRVAVGPDDTIIVLTRQGALYTLRHTSTAFEQHRSGIQEPFEPIDCVTLEYDNQCVLVVVTTDKRLLAFQWSTLELVTDFPPDKWGSYTQIAAHGDKAAVTSVNSKSEQQIKLWEFRNGTIATRQEPFSLDIAPVTMNALRTLPNIEQVVGVGSLGLALRRCMRRQNVTKAYIRTTQRLVDCAWLTDDTICAVGPAGLYRFRITHPS